MLTVKFMFVTIISVIFYLCERSGLSEGKSLDLDNMSQIRNEEEIFFLDSAQATADDDRSIMKDTNHWELEPRSKKTLEEVEKAFRRKNLDEKVERIQSVKSGLLTKSVYIPVVPDDVSENISDGSKVFEEDKSDTHKSKTILDSNKNFRFEEVSTAKNPTVNLNNSLILKNGKLYKLVKIKKNAKRLEEISNRQNRMSRTFTILPNLLSILPVQWMTKETKNDTLDVESKVENQTLTQIITQGVGNNSPQVFNNSIQSSEKIKKLLNLFTIVAFDNAECYSEGLKGYCYHQSECETRGGKFGATCARELGVCCTNQKTCGQKSNENFTYFVYEDPEESSPTSQVCMLTVEKVHPDVAQLRLDFISFQLRHPVNGTCLHDRLVVTGQDTSHLVPEICGVNTGQHIYVDIEDTVGPYNLNLITMGEHFPRTFRVKVTQIKKSDQLLSPKNCLQYYTEPFGTIQTFNYAHFINENLDVSSGYFNNLNYAICIKRLTGFCSISYENEELESLQPSFQLTNVDLEGEKLLPPRQAGAETFDCPDDYIVINGIRLCGEKLNDASVEIDFTKNYPVTDTSNGPFIITVRTNEAVSGRGFYLKYHQNPCVI